MTAAAFARYAGIYLACGVSWNLAVLAVTLWLTRKSPALRRVVLSEFGKPNWFHRVLLWPVHALSTIRVAVKIKFDFEYKNSDLLIASLALFFAFRGYTHQTIYLLTLFVLGDYAVALYAPAVALVLFVVGAAHRDALSLALASLLLAVYVLGQRAQGVASERLAEARAEFEAE